MPDAPHESNELTLPGASLSGGTTLASTPGGAPASSPATPPAGPAAARAPAAGDGRLWSATEMQAMRDAQSAKDAARAVEANLASAARRLAIPVGEPQRVEWEDDVYEYEQRVETVARLKPVAPPPPPPPPPPPVVPRVARAARATSSGVTVWSRKARLSLWGSISLGGLGSLLFAAYYGHAVLAQWGWMVYAPVPVVAPAGINHSRELLERWRAQGRLTGSQRAEAEAAIRADGGTP